MTTKATAKPRVTRSPLETNRTAAAAKNRLAAINTRVLPRSALLDVDIIGRLAMFDRLPIGIQWPPAVLTRGETSDGLSQQRMGT